MKGKAFKSIVLVVSIVLMIAGGANASSPEEIPWGGPTELPDYIGAPAKAHPTANSGVPQDPFLAPYPFAHGHSDIWMSDSANIAGPLGRNPVTRSTTLPQAHQNPDSWLIPCGSMAFDSHGRPIINCFGVNEASVVMVDPDTLEVLTWKSLEVTAGPPFGEGDQKILPSTYAIYGYLDNLDQVHIVSGSRYLITLSEGGSPDNPVFEQVESYDLGALLQPTIERPDGDLISGVVADFQGRYWINMRRSANIYLFDPTKDKEPYTDLPYVNLGEGEFTRNGLALTKEGAAYIVTTQAMYRVDVGADGWPYIVWEEPYHTIGEVRQGQYELGSGTTPTVLGNGKYVAITDNDDRMHVVVYRTDARLGPKEKRVVCEVPVFDFPEGGAGAGSNSLVGLRNSIIAQNTADYLFNWETGELEKEGKPGIERIDIDPNGRGCTKIWANQDVHTNMVLRLSTRNGLIYTQDRKYDATNDVYAVYWVALDFRTGEVVWEQLAGTFDRLGSARFDNFWAPIGIGPNGALYASVYGGLTMLRDGP